MKVFFYQCLIGALALVLAAWAGHHLTVVFLNWTGVIPVSHDARQREISKWIGVVERIVVALLAMCGAVSVTVFVFATKAALIGARNIDGDKKTKREVTEYVLIGTLTSYFFGLLFGLAGWKTAILVEQYLKECSERSQPRAVPAASIPLPVQSPVTSIQESMNPPAPTNMRPSIRSATTKNTEEP